MCVLLSSGQILAGSRVDLDHIADIAEQRNADCSACLNCSGLCGTGCGIAFEAGLGLRDLKFYEHRRLHVEHVSVVRYELDHIIFLDELHIVADNVFAKADLIISLCIHVSIKVAIRIQISIVMPFLKSLAEIIKIPPDVLASNTNLFYTTEIYFSTDISLMARRSAALFGKDHSSELRTFLSSSINVSTSLNSL